MLPNHAPLAVAEQFALLEAAAPGPHRPRHRPRAWLGPGDLDGAARGRGPRRRRHRELSAVPRRRRGADERPRRASGRSAANLLQEQDYILKATPAAVSEPRLWLLGSSMYSAHLAAAKGLPYVFAHHFSGQGTDEALAAYRAEFRPSDLLAEPVTFLTVNASVAPTRAEAEALLLPNLQMMARLRTGQPLGAAGSGRGRRPAATLGAGAGDHRRRAGPHCRRRPGRGGRPGARAGQRVRRRRGDGQPGRLRRIAVPTRRRRRRGSTTLELLAKELSLALRRQRDDGIGRVVRFW